MVNTATKALLSVSVQKNDFEDVYQVSGEAIKEAQHVALNTVKAAPHQPRHYFGKEDKENPDRPTMEIQELAESIKKHGVLQPLLVRRIAGKAFPDPDSLEIVAGERRYRAASYLGLETVPVIVKDLSDEERYEIALIENIQRQNLTPAEECQAVYELKERRHYSESDLMEVLGQGRGWVRNRVAGAKADDDVKVLLDFEDGLSKAILIQGVKDKPLRRDLITAALDGAPVRLLRSTIEARKPKRPAQPNSLIPGWGDPLPSGLSVTAEVDIETGEVLNEEPATQQLDIQGDLPPMQGGPLVSAPENNGGMQPWRQVSHDPAVLLRRSAEAVSAAKWALKNGMATPEFYKNEIAPMVHRISGELREIRAAFENKPE
jgi:ParB family chromosome partitioning protein